MNKEMRKRLSEAQTLINDAMERLQEAKDIVEEISGEERDKFDNATEGLQATERFQTMEENADTMDDFVSELEDIISSLEDADCNETFDL